MRYLTFAVVALVAAVGVVVAGTVRAADPFYPGTFYLGTWTFVTARSAPWGFPARLPDSAEKAQLINKSIVFRLNEIAGPRPFACQEPQYRVSDFTAITMFHGVFEEMQKRDKSVDPEKLAASLGFTGSGIKTVETGCEIDFHFVDATTAEIGLNNMVYTLKKQ